MLKVGIVAGESSGDQLGAQLIEGLRELHPAIEIYGMCGPKMRAAGCHTLADIEQLSVMGIAEVVSKYPQLRRLRSKLLNDLEALKLDIFIGIDVPDFVHYIERKLKLAGVKTAHLVAPQVWAWRPGRAKRLREIVDLLLVLFPFEPEFFTRFGVNTQFVGHPLIKRIPDPVDRLASCKSLGLNERPRYVALMPGSRKQELKRHTALFCTVADRLAQDFPDHRFLIGAVHSEAAQEIESVRAKYTHQDSMFTVTGKSHDLLAVADAALVVSGTVTVEALVSKTPMVVAIRVAPLSYQILKRMIKTPFIAMPNVLAGKQIVPEFVQDQATVDNLTEAMTKCLVDDSWVSEFQQNATLLRDKLSPTQENATARAVLKLVLGEGASDVTGSR